MKNDYKEILWDLKKFLRIGIRENKDWEKEYAKEGDYKWAMCSQISSRDYKYILDRIKELEKKHGR